MPRLGVDAAWVVLGSDGLDELTITGPTFVAALKDGIVSEFEIVPEDAGIKRTPMADLKGGSPEENAAALRQLLDGHPGPYRDIAVLNAAAALVVAGKAPDLMTAGLLAEAAIDNGTAKRALEKLVEISNSAS